LTEEKMAPGDVYGPAQKDFEEAFLSEFSLFVWLWLVVNDRKFLAGTVFFSHTKSASSTSSRSSNEQAQPNEQADGYGCWLSIDIIIHRATSVDHAKTSLACIFLAY